MKKTLQLTSVWMFLALGACTKDPGYHVEKYKETTFEDIASDVRVPGKVWDLLEFKAAEGGEGHEAKKEEKKEEGKEGATLSKDISFAEITVFLVEKNSGIVKNEAIKIQLPKGGGEIDLAQYVTDLKGSFYVGFEFPEFKDSTAQRVLFQSRTRKRRIDDKVLGVGCNQILDITTAFQKAMLKEGLKVNTTRERDVTVLGGTFYFAAQKAGAISVAQVTFTDSRYPNLFCEVQ